MVIEKNIVPIGEHSPYEWCLIGDFADLEARDSYEKHEIHVDIIKGTFTLLDNSIVSFTFGPSFVPSLLISV